MRRRRQQNFQQIFSSANRRYAVLKSLYFLYCQLQAIRLLPELPELHAIPLQASE
jgi:hypothetical protein